MSEKKEVKRMLKKARKYFKLRKKCEKVEKLRREIFSVLKSLGLESYKNDKIWIELYRGTDIEYLKGVAYRSHYYKRFIRKMKNGHIIFYKKVDKK